MNNHRALMVIGLLSLMLLSVYVDVDFAVAQTSGLNAANNVVDQAFETVLSAERAGANVKNLLNRLNSATALLAEAENAFRNGDINSVNVRADEAISIARQVVAAAQDLNDEAEASSMSVFLSTLVLTIIGIVVLVLVLLMVWRFIKRRSIRWGYNSRVRLPVDEA